MALLWTADFSYAGADGLDNIRAQGGTPTGMTDGVHRVTDATAPGGNYINLSSTGTLTYPMSALKFNMDKGAVEFWLYVPAGFHFGIDVENADKNRAILRFAWTASLYLNIQTAQAGHYNRIYAVMPDSVSSHQSATAGIGHMSWAAETWHRVIFFWDRSSPTTTDNYMAFKIDGVFDNVAKDYSHIEDAIDTNQVITLLTLGGTNRWGGRFAGLKTYSDPIDAANCLLPVGAVPPTTSTYFNLQDNGLTDEDTFRSYCPDGDGFASPWETHNSPEPISYPLWARPTDCGTYNADDDYTFFNRPEIEYVYPNYVPDADDVADTYPTHNPVAAWTWQAAKGEIANLFFNLYTKDGAGITGATIQIDQVNGFSSNTIPASACDLTIVYNWFQSGAQDGADSFLSYRPELLRYNDTDNGEGSPGRIELNTNFLQGQFHAPDWATDTKVTTNLLPATSRQFCLTVTVPADCPAGTYSTTVTLYDGETVMATRQLNLQILTFSLSDGGKQHSAQWNPMPLAWFCQSGVGFDDIDDMWTMTRDRLIAVKNMGISLLIIADNYRTGGLGTYPNIGSYWTDSSLCDTLNTAPFDGTKKDVSTYSNVVMNLVAAAKAAGIEEVCLWSAGWTDEGTKDLYDDDIIAGINALKAAGYSGYIMSHDEFGQSLCDTSWDGNFGYITRVVDPLDIDNAIAPFDGNHILIDNGSIWVETDPENPGVGNLYDIVDYLGGGVVKIAENPGTLTGAWCCSGDHIKMVRTIYDNGGICLASRSNFFPTHKSYCNHFPVSSREGIHDIILLRGGGGRAEEMMYDTDASEITDSTESEYYQCLDDVRLNKFRHGAGYLIYLSGLYSKGQRGSHPTFINEVGNFYCEPHVGHRTGFFYENQHDVVWTLQAKSFMEGVRDGKYLYTWKDYYDGCTNPVEAAASKAVIDGILANYMEDTYSPFDAGCRRTAYQYKDDRKTIIAEIQNLRDLSAGRAKVLGSVVAKVNGKLARKVNGVRI